VTTVTVGVQGDTTTQIVSGLSEGDTVVVSLDTAVGTTTTTTSQLGGLSGGVPAGGFQGRPGGN
jgi:macrolide-specific efflux system membrane fusion protein